MVAVDMSNKVKTLNMSFRLESGTEAVKRRASGTSDADVRRQIEQNKLTELMAAVRLQMEVVNGL